MKYFKAIDNLDVGNEADIAVLIYTKSYSSAIASHRSVVETAHSKVILSDEGTYCFCGVIEQLTARYFLILGV